MIKKIHQPLSSDHPLQTLLFCLFEATCRVLKGKSSLFIKIDFLTPEVVLLSISLAHFDGWLNSTKNLHRLLIRN